jgi:Cd2+/Zn2+-exporting ATPase
MQTRTFTVEGLTCIDCAERIRAAVDRVEGAEDIQIDHLTGILTVSLTEPESQSKEIAKAVRMAGYTLATDRRQEEGGAFLNFARFIFSKRETTLTAIAALLTLLALILTTINSSPSIGGGIVPEGPMPLRGWWGAAATALFAAIVVGGAPLARHAFQELWMSHSLGINALMVIAVTGAMLIGEWAEAAIVVVLFSLGEALEGYAADQARGALESLLDLAPPVSLKLLPTGEVRETAVEQLEIGDRVLVRPGDRVSVDGVVRAGESEVDQAPITGESVPVEKKPGDKVFAGTINTSGALEVEVTRLAADNTLSRMVALVREAQSRQAPVQRFIDRFARVYTPAVAGMAALVAVVPPLFFGQPFWGDHGWLMRALQMLVIACPCALVISTPVSLVSAMANAASRGVLIKGGRYVEALSQIRAFAFDKTGTLTQGRPVITDVVDVCTCGNCPENCGLEHAASVEAQSSHPLALALLNEAEARGVAVPSAQDVTLLSGRGMEGTVNGARVTVASHAHFDEYIPHQVSVCRQADELAAQGKTVIMVRHDDEVCMMFGAADVPRPSSRQALADLRARGIHTVMLTGDSPTVAEKIGRQVGIDEVRAGLLPEEKVSAVVALAEEYQTVAMVGDGVNDAPALAQADVGIAMGGAGSAQAMETADIVLMGDDLAQLPFVVQLSRKVRQTVAANIVFALAVKAAVFALAVAGLATLWMAIVADVGASLAVILNGVRLRRV